MWWGVRCGCYNRHQHNQTGLIFIVFVLRLKLQTTKTQEKVPRDEGVKEW